MADIFLTFLAGNKKIKNAMKYICFLVTFSVCYAINTILNCCKKLAVERSSVWDNLLLSSYGPDCTCLPILRPTRFLGLCVNLSLIISTLCALEYPNLMF